MDLLKDYLSRRGSHLHPVGGHPSSVISLLGRLTSPRGQSSPPRGEGSSQKQHATEKTEGEFQRGRVTFPGLSNGIFRGLSQEVSGASTFLKKARNL